LQLPSQDVGLDKMTKPPIEQASPIWKVSDEETSILVEHDKQLRSQDGAPAEQGQGGQDGALVGLGLQEGAVVVPGCVTIPVKEQAK
jgi:hypothetical protein